MGAPATSAPLRHRCERGTGASGRDCAAESIGRGKDERCAGLGHRFPRITRTDDDTRPAHLPDSFLLDFPLLEIRSPSSDSHLGRSPSGNDRHQEVVVPGQYFARAPSQAGPLPVAVRLRRAGFRLRYEDLRQTVRIPPSSRPGRQYVAAGRERPCPVRRHGQRRPGAPSPTVGAGVRQKGGRAPLSA